jgi:hypothetical protein
MDLRGEEGESCIAAEESKCNRLASYGKREITSSLSGCGGGRPGSSWEREEGRATEGEKGGTEALVINICRG